MLEAAVRSGVVKELEKVVGSEFVSTNRADLYIYSQDMTQAEPCHGLGFTGEAGYGLIIQFLGLYQAEGDITVELGVVGKVDLLHTAFTQELLHLVTATDKGGGFGGGWFGRLCFR